jgi:hypothetical protein
LRNFKEGIGIINVLGKSLPFKNSISSYTTDDYTEIAKILSSPNSKVNSVVIDDAGYLMTNQFMSGHAKGGEGNAIYKFFNTIGDNYWGLIRFVVNLPPEKLVYFFMHEDKNDMGDVKPKTIGKMLDEKVCIEGMFTIVLRCVFENNKHVFKTQSDGYDVAKSPMDMFSAEIDNDLKMVDETIRKYYNLGGKKDDK